MSDDETVEIAHPDDEPQVIDLAARVLALLIGAGAGPGIVGSIGLLMIEHSLVAGKWQQENASKAIDDIYDHLRDSVEHDTLIVQPAMVETWMQRIAEQERDQHEIN